MVIVGIKLILYSFDSLSLETKLKIILMNFIFKLTLFFSCLFTSQLLAQLEITEYSASNLNQFQDNYDKHEDWIEVHNSGSTAMDISGYALSDKESKPQKWLFPNGTILQPDGYLVVWCSGRDERVNHSYHTNFKLSQTKNKDYVVLADPSGNILESHKLELTLLGHSREKNSNGKWMVVQEPSPAYRNPISTRKNGYTTAPSFDMTAGYYPAGNVRIQITNNEPDSEIRFTRDGTEPNSTSQLYSGAVTINNTTVLKARAFSQSDSILPGKMNFATYFIEDIPTMPVISIAAETLQDLANGTKELRPIGSIEYFKNGDRTSMSYGELNSHGQDSWVNPQRSLDWVSRDEMGYNNALNEKLFSYSERDEYQRFMMRCSGDDNYPANGDEDHEGSAHVRDEYVHELALRGGLKLDTRAVERTLVFLNGDYWGIYSPRERPVDHDYTAEYYDQGKYDLQYLLTWGETWPEYGGQKALDDYIFFRDFIMENDMSIESNYQMVKDSFQVLSLIDYMLVNLNTVCSDWINYNTGVWRGLNPEGSHKKWGYILWDNDATFDYYINYSGVPNTDADAELCDIEEIADFVDDFFLEGSGPVDGIDEETAEFCTTIQDGTSPYPASDPYFLETINERWQCCFLDWDQECQSLYDEFAIDTRFNSDNCNSGNLNLVDTLLQKVLNVDTVCCNTWDNYCQELYDEIELGTYVPYKNKDQLKRVDNVGMHEQIFLKLQKESPEFKQLYYSRQADLINTTFSCDNMLNTLDSLIAIIDPEMNRHINRWGRSYSEWKSNVSKLRTFIEDRCNNLSDGLINCYDLDGPYNLTLEVFPEGAGTIDFNTLKDISSFPWNGQYYGGIENLIDADPGSEYDFLRWESKKGQVIFPNESSENAQFMMQESDTLVAIFALETAVEDLNGGVELTVFPTPSSGMVTLEYNLLNTSMVDIRITDMLGRELRAFPSERIEAGREYTKEIDFRSFNSGSGNFILTINTESGSANTKVTIVN